MVAWPIHRWIAGCFVTLSSSELSAWLKSYPSLITAIVSFVAISVSIIALFRTRNIANRTVRIEAQKLLLEVNKALVVSPRLFSIFDSGLTKKGEKANCPEQPPPCKNGCPENGDECRKLRAFAYMKLNVFEIVLAVHPKGDEAATWERYFEHTLKNSRITRTVLKENLQIYSDELIVKAFLLYPPLMNESLESDNKEELKRLQKLKSKALKSTDIRLRKQEFKLRTRSEILLSIADTLRAGSSMSRNQLKVPERRLG